MGNVILNTTSLLILMCFAIVVSFTIKITDIFVMNTYNMTTTAIDYTNIENIPPENILHMVKSTWLNIKSIIQAGTDFILIITTSMLFYSSFVSRYDFGSFIANFFGALITSSIVYYLFIVLIPSLLLNMDITLSAIATTFYENIGTLLLINLLGFTASWLFSLQRERNA